MPPLLAGNLRSLLGGEEQLAFFALIRLNTKGDVIKVEFDRSVIKCNGEVTYEKDQNLIDEASEFINKGRKVTDKVTSGLAGNCQDSACEAHESDPTSNTVTRSEV